MRRFLAALACAAFGATAFNSSSSTKTRYEDTQFGVLALQRSVNGFDGQLSYFTRYDALHFMPDPDRRPVVERHCFRHQPAVLYQRHPGRRLVPDQPGAYLARGLHRQRRANLGRQYVVGRADTRRSGDTAADIDHRRHRQARLARRRLCPGRMEDHRPADDECRAALRPDVAIHRRQSAKPARQLHLQAVHEHDAARRLCALFHAAGAGRGGAGRYRVVRRHDGAPARAATSPVLPERSHYFDAGVDQKIPFGCYTADQKDCTTLDLGLDAYYKIATDLLDNGNFGQALVLSAFNYAKGIIARRRVFRQVPQRQFPGLWQSRRGSGEGHPGGVEPISVRQRHDAARARRPDRAAIYQTATGSTPITISSSPARRACPICGTAPRFRPT